MSEAHGRGRAWDPGGVEAHGGEAEGARGLDERRDVARLPVSELEHERGSLMEEGGKRREEDAQGVEAVAPAVERERGLELRDRLREVGRVSHGNVGRVRDHEIEEGPARERGEPVGRDGDHARTDAVAARVGGGEGEGRRRAIDRDDARAGALERQRHGEDAAPRAEVGESPGVRSGGARRFHDAFRLAARDQSARVDEEGPAQKFPFAEEVLQRLARGAARDELREGRPCRRLRGFAPAAVKPGAGACRGPGEQLFRLVRSVILAREAAPPLGEKRSPGRVRVGGGAHAGLVFKMERMSGPRILVLFGADRSSPNPGSRSDPVTSVHAAFGPAVDAMDAVAVYTLDRSGRIGYANRGARRVLDVDGRDVEGRSASELPAAGSETPEMVEGLNEVFETGRPRVARRIMLLADGTTRVESIVSMTPVVRYGKVVEAAVWRVDTRGPAGGDEHRARLLDSSPAGLLGVDASGRIEAVSRRLAEWVGRRADALEGLDVERTEVLPVALRGHIRAQALNRAPQGTPTAIVEDDVPLVTPEGVSCMFHVLVAPHPGGGADAVFLEGGSRRRLLAELDAARRALAEARETAMDVLQSTTRDLKARVQEIVAAARRAGDETSGPIQRARAEAELLASSDEFLARVGGAVPEDDGSGRRSIGGADGRPRVLLVEDNEENRELLAHMLRSRGAEVLTAANGREAVDAAAGFRFDFVLLDLQMPAMDGFQVLRRLRALPGGDRLPVVALTALTSDLVKERCEAEGMNDFVSKPVTLARIGELVAKWGRGGITTSSGTASRKR